MISKPAAPALRRNLLEITTLGLYPRPNESEILKAGLVIWILISLETMKLESRVGSKVSLLTLHLG